MNNIKQKLYCYVDENGQDTKGKIFIVTVVVTGTERDALIGFCEELENKSGKKKVKWRKASHERRINHLKSIFSSKNFKRKLRFSVYRNQSNYDLATIKGIAKAILFKEPASYTTLIYIDGLAKTKRHNYGSDLRKLGIPTRKVQGVAKDKNNALTRLADSIAGFVRDVIDGKDLESKTIFEDAVKKETLVEV